MNTTPYGFWLRIITAWDRRNEEADQWTSLGVAAALFLASVGIGLLVGGALPVAIGASVAAIWPAVWLFGLWEEGGEILAHRDDWDRTA